MAGPPIRKPGSYANIVRAFAHVGREISPNDARRIREAIQDGYSPEEKEKIIREICEKYGLREIPRGLRDSIYRR